MERCGTCKRWMESTIHNRSNETEWFRKYRRNGYCVLASTYQREAIHRDSMMVAMDAIGVSATAVTDADFGCVQHEPREDARD